MNGSVNNCSVNQNIVLGELGFVNPGYAGNKNNAMNSHGYWWTSGEEDSGISGLFIRVSNNENQPNQTQSKGMGHALRCVK
jgi:hypothetical protein